MGVPTLSTETEPRRKFFCIVTLSWFEPNLGHRPSRWPGRQQITKQASWRGIATVDPLSDREQLAEDVIAKARELHNAPEDAVVVFLSIEPNDL